MSEQAEIKDRQTWEQLCIAHSVQVNTVRVAYNRGKLEHWPQWSSAHIPTLEMIEAIPAFRSGAKPKNAQPVQRVVAKQKVSPGESAVMVFEAPIQNNENKCESKGNSTEEAMLFWFPMGVNAFSIILTIAGLYTFFGAFGLLLGLMFAAYLIPAVWVARNNMKGDTSEAALKAVLNLEIGACLLHLCTFFKCIKGHFDISMSIPQGYSDFLPYAICFIGAVIPASFVAYLSYHAVYIVRNYNAE